VIFTLLRLSPGAIVDILFSTAGCVSPSETQAVSAAEYARKAPHLVLFPGVAIGLAVFGSNLLGDTLRDTLDPRLRGA
jgi:hypothetical protein